MLRQGVYKFVKSFLVDYSDSFFGNAPAVAAFMTIRPTLARLEVIQEPVEFLIIDVNRGV